MAHFAARSRLGLAVKMGLGLTVESGRHHVHLVADNQAAEMGNEIVAVADGGTIHGDDDAARLYARLVSRRTSRDARYQCAAPRRQLVLRCKTLRHVARLEAQRAPPHTPVLVELDADAVRPFPAGFDYVYALGAGIRVVQMAGALDSVLGLSTRYVQERKQFGKPIGKFQAVQQNLAVMAGQVAAARSAANTVAHGFGADDPGHVMAGAKTRVGEAATIAAGLAHQVHGAMGFTQEYELHFFTKRLWSWRDEFGSEVYWSRHLGREVFQRGADATWDFITARMG